MSLLRCAITLIHRTVPYSNCRSVLLPSLGPVSVPVSLFASTVQSVVCAAPSLAMDHFVRVDSVEKKEKEQAILNPAVVPDADQDELEEDEAIIEEQDAMLYGNANHDGQLHKEISAPYAVPHYPIELEEQKKNITTQQKLKELEERATISTSITSTSINGAVEDVPGKSELRMR